MCLRCEKLRTLAAELRGLTCSPQDCDRLEAIHREARQLVGLRVRLDPGMPEEELTRELRLRHELTRRLLGLVPWRCPEERG